MTINQNPLVTVITPTFNRANYVKQTIDSILSQDYPNIECIVLDDGSTDNTIEILASYSDRIIWESHPNMGETRTVNKGYRKAKGQIIGVVNSDDLLLPGAISAAVKTFMENPDILVAYPGWIYINDNSERLYEEFVPEFNYEEMVRKHWCVVGPASFISRKAFDLTNLRDEKLKYVADFEYWLRLGLYGPFKRIPGTYGTFRIHNSSASVQLKNSNMANEHVQMMIQYYSLDRVPRYLKTGRLFHEAWSSTYLHAARTCLPGSKDANRYYLQSFLQYPSSMKFLFQDSYTLLKSSIHKLKNRVFKNH